MTDAPDAASVATEPNDDVLTILGEDGTVTAYAQVSRNIAEQVAAELRAKGVNVDHDESPDAARHLELAASFVEGNVVRPREQVDRWLTPKLTVPRNYYTRVVWSKEYYEQESLVNALVDRDIDQAIKRVEFQLPEDADKADVAKKVLEKWRTELNEQVQQHDGLHEFNRQTALRIINSSLVVCIANWGPMEIDGKFYQVPKVLQNLDPCLLVPDRDPFTAVTTYYYKLTPALADKLRASRRQDNAWRQMIPDLGRNIVDALPERTQEHYRRDGVDREFLTGPFLRLPPELVYVIRFRAEPEDDFPNPTLTPIFSALAMKRKLQLADWAVADGMINMLMVWSFPAGTTPDTAKSIVKTAASGGRVQSISIPALVKVEIITPPHEMLNSKDKFWIPLSEILAHFGFPLNSESRGAGDLDSGALDLSSNAGRLNALRDTIEALNNFWLRQIAKKNGWTKFTPTVLLPRLDLTNSDTLRSHILAVYDRGSLSEETLADSVGTTLAREVARRKREKKDGIEDVLEIRPSFSQTTGVPGDGRTPDSEAKGKSGRKENRPKTSAQSESRS